MVNENSFGGVHNFSVHRNSFAIIAINVEPNGIDTLVISFCGPVEVIEPVVFIGVNNREKTFAEGDFAKWPAEAESTKSEKRPDEDTVEPVWNFDLNSSHNHTPRSLFIVHCSAFVVAAMNNEQQTTNSQLMNSLALLGHILRFCANCLASPPPGQCGGIIPNAGCKFNTYLTF